jgi:hypothetical protein
MPPEQRGKRHIISGGDEALEQLVIGQVGQHRGRHLSFHLQ